MVRNRAFRYILAGLLVLVFLVVAAILVVNSARFHRYILTKAIQDAESSLGSRVEIGDFRFHWSGLHIDLFRVAVYGAQQDSEPALFQADHLGIGLKVVSLWKRKIDLQDVTIEHPVIHFIVDQQGRTNMPQTSTSSSGEPTDIFDLGIQHVAIRQGEVDYRDRKTPLQAELEDVEAQVSSVAFQKAYNGTLSYRNGRVQYGDFNPLEHDLQAQFSASPGGATLKSLRLSSGSSSVTAQANLRDYNNPSIDGSYAAQISTAEVGRVMKDPSLPTGEIVTTGAVQYRNSPDQPFLNSLSVQGKLSAPSLAVNSPQARVALRALSGEYRLQQGDVEVHDVQADILGGHASAELSIKNVAGSQKGQFAASLKNISLAATNAALTSKPLDGAKIVGHIDGTANATWQGSMQAIQLHSDLTIAASEPLAPELAASSGAIPLNGTVHASYDGRRDTISLQDTSFRTPHTSIALNGTLASQSSMRIEARSDDLREVDMLAASFPSTRSNSFRPASKPQLLGLSGSASFDGQLQGTTKQPRLTGQVQAQNVSYQGAKLRTASAQLDASSSQVALHQGQLQMSSQGNVQFDVAMGLSNWSYRRSNPIRVRATANNVPVGELERLANLQYPVTGTVSAQASIQGSAANPTGQASVRLTAAQAWGQPIQNLTVNLQASGDSIHSNLNLRTPAGSGTATLLYYPGEDAFEVHADFPGVQIDKLDLVRNRNLPLSGVVKLVADGRGTLQSPQLTADVDTSNLKFRGQPIDQLKAHGTLAGKRAGFSVDSVLSGASVQARGTVDLNGNYDANATFDTQMIQLGPLIGSYAHGHVQDFRGQTQLHASLSGPLKEPNRVQAHLEIPTLRVSYQSVELAAAQPIRADYREGTLTLTPAEIKGTDTDIRINAVVPVVGDGQLRATATGSIDLQLAHMLYPEADTSGQVKIDVTAQGTRAHPQFQGGVRIVDGAFEIPDAPLGVSKLNADFDVQKDRVTIKNLTAQSGGGTLTGRGSVAYSPIRYDLAVAGNNIRIRYPEGVRMLLRTNLALTGTYDSGLLSGQVFLTRLSTTQAFDVSTIADQFTGPESAPMPGMAENIRLNVSVQSSQDMQLAATQFNLSGVADLRVQGTLADPVIIGRTELRSGELFFNGRRYQISSGVIQFVNPIRTQPVVNLVVTTTVSQYNVTMTFIGPIDNMRTTYTSDPPLAPVDVLNLLIRGNPTEAASASGASPQSVVAGQVAGQVSNRIQKLAGISSLTIDPQIGGTSTNPGARLAIQQRVTRKLFFTFATDVTASTDSLIQVEYQATKKYSLSALRDQNGGYSFLIKMRKKF